jgi:hypothetical protein
MIVALALWVAGHELAYRWIGVWFAPWYQVYLVDALLALAAFAAVEGPREVTLRLPRFSRRPAAASPWMATTAAALALPILAPSIAWVARSWRSPPDSRQVAYAAAGDYLRSHAPPDATVLAFEIGALGYHADRRILDYGGLVSPEFAAAKFTGRRGALAARLRPDYVVFLDGFADVEALVRGPQAAGRYELERSFGSAGGRAARVYRRVDRAPRPPRPAG